MLWPTLGADAAAPSTRPRAARRALGGAVVLAAAWSRLAADVIADGALRARRRLCLRWRSCASRRTLRAVDARPAGWRCATPPHRQRTGPLGGGPARGADEEAHRALMRQHGPVATGQPPPASTACSATSSRPGRGALEETRHGPTRGRRSARLGCSALLSRRERERPRRSTPHRAATADGGALLVTGPWHRQDAPGRGGARGCGESAFTRCAAPRGGRARARARRLLRRSIRLSRGARSWRTRSATAHRSRCPDCPRCAASGAVSSVDHRVFSAVARSVAQPPATPVSLSRS